MADLQSVYIQTETIVDLIGARYLKKKIFFP